MEKLTAFKVMSEIFNSAKKIAGSDYNILKSYTRNDETYLYDIEGYQVHLDPLRINVIGLVVAGTVLAPTDKTMETLEPIIIVDHHFTDLPIDIQEFILYHEAGHCKNGDIEEFAKDSSKMSDYKKSAFTGRTPKIELMADAHAAAIIGVEKAVKALEYISKLTPAANQYQIIERIGAVKEMTEDEIHKQKFVYGAKKLIKTMSILGGAYAAKKAIDNIKIDKIK